MASMSPPASPMAVATLPSEPGTSGSSTRRRYGTTHLSVAGPWGPPTISRSGFGEVASSVRRIWEPGGPAHAFMSSNSVVIGYALAMPVRVPRSSQAGRGGRLPDFLLVGAPKCGTTALHAALAEHPELYLSQVKEPKYYLCGDSPPPTYRGPGDAHSNQEWIWQRQRYLDLFADAGDEQAAGESTPFYLYHRDARRRIAADNPGAKL